MNGDNNYPCNVVVSELNFFSVGCIDGHLVESEQDEGKNSGWIFCKMCE